MANSIEHKIPARINNLIYIQGPDYKILQVVGTGVTDYYPSINKNGNHMSLNDYSFEEMLAAKIHKQRLTVRLLVKGNAVSAEIYIKSIGYDCLAISPDHVDVYVPLMAQA